MRAGQGGGGEGAAAGLAPFSADRREGSAGTQPWREEGRPLGPRAPTRAPPPQLALPEPGSGPRSSRPLPAAAWRASPRRAPAGSSLRGHTLAARAWGQAGQGRDLWRGSGRREGAQAPRGRTREQTPHLMLGTLPDSLRLLPRRPSTPIPSAAPAVPSLQPTESGVRSAGGRAASGARRALRKPGGGVESED